METITYDPATPVPALTPENEPKLRERRRVLGPLSTRASRDMAERVGQLELFLIEAIFAAAVRDPLRTLGDAWRVVAPRSTEASLAYEGSRQYRGLQNEFAEALNNLNKILSR